MLRITQKNSADAAKSYYSTADYYNEGQEIVGHWGGKGAARLGLEGTVDKLSFERLCDNLHPVTGESLTVRTRTDRTVGYDFTFSVPKSVSLLYALSGDQGIMDSFRRTVDETMKDIESELQTRVRRGHKDVNRLTGNAIWGEFIHTTSRPVDGVPDPQLHAHCFVFNSTFDEEEKRWKAGQFRELKRDAPYFQAAFRVRLANHLQDQGFAIERKRGDFEIAGLPADILKRYSRRTDLIEKTARAKGITDPKRKDELGAETRERKVKALSWDALRKEWDSRLDNQERAAIAAVHGREHVGECERHQEGVSVDHAIEHSYVRDAVVPERMLATEALKYGIGAVTVDDVLHELQARPLIRKKVEGRDMATTKEMRSLESRLVEFARDGRGRLRPLGDHDRPFVDPDLDDGQKAAVRHVIGSRDKVMVIRGAAGTGKTTLLKEIREAMNEIGKPIVAIAQSVKASREVLRSEGFATADTVASFLKDSDMQKAARNGIIFVDEASQLGTRDMLKVFEAAEQVGARVLLVGDRRQHRSVMAGEPLKLLEETAGLKVAEVTKIWRQKNDDYKNIAQALSEGRIGHAFEILDKIGWIKEIQGDERYKAMAEAYLSAAQEKKKDGKPKSALVVSPTHAEGDRITQSIREGLKEQHKLGEERVLPVWISRHLTDAQKADATEYDLGDMLQFHQNAPGHTKGSRLTVSDGVKPPTEIAKRFETYRPAELALASGDRIRITAGGTTKDGNHRLSNGTLMTVQGFTKHGDIVVDHGWVIDKDFGHVAHGYAMTSHASQGLTVDKVFIGISADSFPATDERAAYVAGTRGREQALFFTDDRNELLRVMGREDEPLSAMDISGSEQKPSLPVRVLRRLGFNRGNSVFDGRQNPSQMGLANESVHERERDNAG